jgi:Fic family protein
MFRPKFQITPAVAKALMRIEGAKQAITLLPMTTAVQANLRESARLQSTHYSTQIEGNRLTLDQAERVILRDEHFPGRERDELEVRGYYRALDELDRLRSAHEKISETTIQTLHALVMAGGKSRVKPTPYRDGQNVIKDSRTGAIVYLPPEAKDVPGLMKELVTWIGKNPDDLPCPLRAGIVHYQLATIHPYYDGNGRLARLLATLVLHLEGYDLKGFYSLEEYYARDLSSYYRAISVGPSHNYYKGRAETEITGWIEYFCVGMATAFESVQKRAGNAAKAGEIDQSEMLRMLDGRQRKTLGLFRKSDVVTAMDVGKLFKLADRTARVLCQKWVENGFLTVADPAKKSRRYRLSNEFRQLLK